MKFKYLAILMLALTSVSDAQLKEVDTLTLEAPTEDVDNVIKMARNIRIELFTKMRAEKDPIKAKKMKDELRLNSSIKGIF